MEGTNFQADATGPVLRSLQGWEELPSPNTQFPVMFHGMEGEETREANSPSWFNPVEANEVLKYVRKLTERRPPVKAEDVGVVTPYHKQKMKIKDLLAKNGFKEVKVGSVEMFQVSFVMRLCVSSASLAYPPSAWRRWQHDSRRRCLLTGWRAVAGRLRRARSASS